MTSLESLCLRFKDGRLEVLDQRLLPHRETWISAQTADEMIAAIQALAIRGAPAIGVAAALSLANAARQGRPPSQLKTDSAKLRASRPTAVNLMVALDRMDRLLTKSASSDDLMAEAVRIFDEDVELCDRIARHGVSVIQKDDGILTHCNTGGLATAGRGTAFGVFHLAHEQGLNVHVYVDETRPLLQGGRLTAWECAKRGIPHTLIADHMA
ncbi:MAG TPA: S-methyl-5-thioribose-1-phosphate isomerase, partial [Pseudobdellovibrionaceae bacterium]|nr:S-methyl-5-thioribose-1-phosphate isomerase [Pseudobdellovibrionaceae bacterium]